MTTVIPALSGGMGPARTVSQPDEAAKPSGFSALLAQASHDAASNTESAAAAASAVTAPPSSAKAASAESDGDALADAALADVSLTGDAVAGDKVAEKANTEGAKEAPLASDAAETRAGDQAGEEQAGALADGQMVAFPPPGGKVLPVAATPSAEEPKTAASAAGELVTQDEHKAALRPPAENESREPAGPPAQQLNAEPKVRAPSHAAVQPQATETAPAGKGDNAEATPSAVDAGQPIEVKPGPRTVEDNSKIARSPENTEPAAKPSSAAGTENKGIPLAGMTPLGNPAEQLNAAFTEPPAAVAVSGIEGKGNAQAQAQRLPAGETVSAAMLRPAADTPVNRSEPPQIMTAVEPADGELAPEQAAQPRQDAAITRQESQRQPATPEWLAQIEHGRRWQQAQQSGTATVTVTDQAGVSHTEAPDADLPRLDNTANAKGESAEPEDNASRTGRLSEAMTPAQGNAAREASGQPPAALDGQLPPAAVTAGREAGTAVPERAPLPQGERVLNLHQGSPEQNARQLSQQVQVMVNRELQEADIRLNPSELGGMRIQLKFEQGEVSMQIQAQHAQARDLLEQAMPRLRDLLNQQGIQLGQGQVGGFAGQQGSSAQNGASGQGATGRENGHNSAPFEPDAGEGEPAHGSYGTGAFASNGRIDFFA